ncbi:hypothetical protein OF83DRAFT_1070772 [Amylostereum chailletii]|nr:hypothetical protein OF83DRAFT_1070772 [Amylostereum chailletii]
MENSSSLDGILAQIVGTGPPGLEALNKTLRGFSNKDVREVILSSLTSNGEDPLSLLDVVEHTLGVLYILSARLSAPVDVAPPVPLAFIEDFCARFNAMQARIAPERVTLLAKGIIQTAELHGNLKAAISPLYNLLTRYAPDLSYLTPIHPLLLTICLTTSHYTSALPLIETPISNISLALCPDLVYTDHLVYHYAGGVIAAALRRFELAAEMLEICASAPPSAVQAEAMKKLVLVQLILHGKTLPLPKYTHAGVSRFGGPGSPYGALAKAYPTSVKTMMSIVQKEQNVFAADQNVGLVKQALDRAPRWTLKQLTEIYLTLGLTEIGQAVGIDDPEEVRRVVLSMIEVGEINASLSADGTVAFADDPPVRVSKAEMDAVLRRAQAQERVLHELEREMARSKEYLSKVRFCSHLR